MSMDPHPGTVSDVRPAELPVRVYYLGRPEMGGKVVEVRVADTAYIDGDSEVVIEWDDGNTNVWPPEDHYKLLLAPWDPTGDPA